MSVRRKAAPRTLGLTSIRQLRSRQLQHRQRPRRRNKVRPFRIPRLIFGRAMQSFFHLTSCGSGGTGRRTILRGWRRKAWGFESPLPHQSLSKAHENVGFFFVYKGFLMILPRQIEEAKMCHSVPVNARGRAFYIVNCATVFAPA
jgi:hypothetical protein